MARAVEREEVSSAVARRAVVRIIEDPKFTVEEAFKSSVQAVDFARGTEQLADRLVVRIEEHQNENYAPTDSLRETLENLGRSIRRFLRG
jgi:hypothetical protein